MITEMRSIEPFTQIRFKDVGTLILTQGDVHSLQIEADDEVLAMVVSEVRGETLHLGMEGDWLDRIGKMISSVFNSDSYRITYNLSVVRLEEVRISGKCKLTCKQLAADQLKLLVSGLGDLAINQLDCDSLAVVISGRGSFKASGRAAHQDIRISGSGDYEVPSLSSQSAKIVISGQGNAAVCVEDDLDITISGLGQVNYYGHPRLRQVISGFGRSKKLKDE